MHCTLAEQWGDLNLCTMSSTGSLRSSKTAEIWPFLNPGCVLGGELAENWADLEDSPISTEISVFFPEAVKTCTMFKSGFKREEMIRNRSFTLDWGQVALNSSMFSLLIFPVFVGCLLPLPCPLLLLCPWHVFRCDFAVHVWVVRSVCIFFHCQI